MLLVPSCTAVTQQSGQSLSVLHEGLAEQGGGDVPRGKLGNPKRSVEKQAITVKTPYQTFDDGGKVLAQPSTGSYSMEHLMVMLASQQGNCDCNALFTTSRDTLYKIDKTSDAV